MNAVNLSPEKLLEQVKNIQASQKLTDGQMAEKIGCSRVLYQQTRTGKIKVGDTFRRGAVKLIAAVGGGNRKAGISRQTRETNILLEINLDGSGSYDIASGVPIFDHFLSQLSRHGMIDITLKASGDDTHHIVEDVAICLGRAFGEALGDKRGIVRMADATVPMDEALAMVALDISGRGYAVTDIAFTGNDISGLPADLVRHFLESFAIEARITLYAAILCGTNDHHRAEALFKALGHALDRATRIDPRLGGELPSTKGHIEK